MKSVITRRKVGVICLLALALLALPGCGAQGAPGESSPGGSAPGRQEADREETEMPGSARNIEVEINGKTYAASLEDNDTAAAFAERIPLTLQMEELNGNEKYAYADEPLPSDPAEVGRIEAGDIMLYGDDCIVVFYKSFDTQYSYTRIGRIDDADGIEDAAGGGAASVRFIPAD